MEFIVTGEAEVGRETLPFEKIVTAESEKHAKDVLYSIYGSKHNLSQSKVHIESIEEV